MKRPPSLSSKREFERVLRTGTRIRAACGTIFVAPASDPGSAAHLGLAVPGRVGGAVTRNRIKRRLRAAFDAAPVPAGLDVVVRPSPTSARLGFQELEETFANLGPVRDDS